MADDANGDLFAGPDALGKAFQLVAAIVGRLEGDDVDVEPVEIGQGVGVEAAPRFCALGGGVAPAGVAPHFALIAQAAYLAVEGFDQKIAANLSGVDTNHAVDRRLLNLDHGTAGVGELVELRIHDLR